MTSYLDRLPDTSKGAVVVLSGGLDSTIVMRLCVEKYGADNVRAVTFDYGQKQRVEIERAAASTTKLGVVHKIFDLSILNEISQGFSANVDADIEMPTIEDVLGDPRPPTYVPNRNMILMSLCAAYAETQDINTIVMGLQVHDEYGYHDTTQKFVDKINSALSENRNIKVKVLCPFVDLSKLDELNLLNELDGNLELLKDTITCYNPDVLGRSCGVGNPTRDCPSCSERLAAFAKFGVKDPIEYQR